ncbi:unnamed protein product [Parascedosporium putredinis]|uniref:DNA-directed RNA polymerase n=1 Tax=Parascedosporium putredinis TaxID=1442378 RepID=A0A9P1GXJ5_9PEZI|nr:unnamed protein product [Parascedosporium putredinis]CAI7989867.1 unnamed protein product [Parascedosporium putredinis]
MEQTLENAISGSLSRVRQQAGQICIDTLSRNNAALIMAQSGSKGSNINVSQMVALVGQQIINGQRVADGFQDRSLPHFPKNTRQPPAKGFVRNSFYSGLTPTEFVFHAMSGREGLVDTAVKTAETGYMSRRLMKSLEDLSTQYDNTVRTSGGNIVQFQFGADKLDPVDMEGAAVPVNFDRIWTHSESLTRDNSSSIAPDEITRLSSLILGEERKRRIEKAHLSDILVSIEDEYRPDTASVILHLATEVMESRHLGMSTADIMTAIYSNKKLKVGPEDISVTRPNSIRVKLRSDAGTSKRATKSRSAAGDDVGDLVLRANFLRRALPTIAISGYPETSRTIIETSQEGTHTIFVEGYGLRACMTTEGVLGTRTQTNNIMECKDVLGIEAARTSIATEIGKVMKGMDIDPRHMQLLADVMTYKGELLSWNGDGEDNTADAKHLRLAVGKLYAWLRDDSNCHRNVIFGRSGNTVVGLYVDGEVQKASAAKIVQRFLDGSAAAAASSARRVGVQVYKDKTPSTWSLGIFADLRGNVSSVQGAVKSLYDGECWRGADAEDEWDDVKLSIFRAVDLEPKNEIMSGLEQVGEPVVAKRSLNDGANVLAPRADKVQEQFGLMKGMIGIKRILSFGGWTFSTEQPTYTIFREGVTEANRATLINNVVSFINEHGLDGVDFDWEYPAAPDLPIDDPGKLVEGLDYLDFVTQVKA